MNGIQLPEATRTIFCTNHEFRQIDLWDDDSSETRETCKGMVEGFEYGLKTYQDLISTPRVLHFYSGKRPTSTPNPHENSSEVN